ncbi:hypothetical protein SAMN05421807_106103 [Virgibacillus chiguensis]|uniref:Uncharacterized protein n=1 Tax=Virgibacillus chiguensis TaxID=411959 RepID=A0A1M5S9B3_9BACI|nr:hypothetical protein SAMN05421807_106103 [Virgibacillus chiguensis]
MVIPPPFFLVRKDIKCLVVFGERDLCIVYEETEKVRTTLDILAIA